jgi:protein SCO1/2
MAPVRTPLILAMLAALAILPGLAGCGPSSGGQGQASGQPAIGGPFQLVDQNNRAVDQRLLDGKWTLVYFGYTFCPDVCPTTLTVLGQAQARLGSGAKALQVLFISVDPERDNPAELKTYLSSPVFPKGVLGLTGTPAQVAAVAKAYRVFYQKQGAAPAYSVDHTSAIYLMDPKGQFDRVLAESLAPEEIARQISDAMRDGPKARL